MKALVCEMCNSNDLVKQDGMYVCQNCGTKYTIEEAKKLMGTVKIDDTDELKNLYELARRAKENNNSDNAQKYYEQILVKNPSSWEANFYSVYYQSLNTVIAGISNAAISFTNNLKTVFLLIKKNIDDNDCYSKVLEVYNCSVSLATALFRSACTHYQNYNTDGRYFYEASERCIRSAEILYGFVNYSIMIFPDDDNILSLDEQAVDMYNKLLSYHPKRPLGIKQPITPHSLNEMNDLIQQKRYSLNLKVIHEKTKGKSNDEMIAFAKSEIIKYPDNIYIPLCISETIENEFGKSAFTEFLKAIYYLRLGTAENEKSAAAKIESAKRIGGLTREDVADLIDLGQASNDVTLLMISACHLKYDAIAYLIELGADVNKKTSAYNVTALWYVAFEKKENIDEQYKCAKLLLDNGAETNITNKGGVALLNPNTPIEIKKMILAKNPNTQVGKAPQKKGCYVATAVYGSYDCPQVWTLRRYRDDTLAKTWHGRAFIHTYYAISPTLVKWFGNTNWFKNMWKPKLDKMVNNLNLKGVENTPYEDKKW